MSYDWLELLRCGRRIRRTCRNRFMIVRIEDVDRLRGQLLRTTAGRIGRARVGGECGIVYRDVSTTLSVPIRSKLRLSDFSMFLFFPSPRTTSSARITRRANVREADSHRSAPYLKNTCNSREDRPERPIIFPKLPLVADQKK